MNSLNERSEFINKFSFLIEAQIELIEIELIEIELIEIEYTLIHHFLILK